MWPGVLRHFLLPVSRLLWARYHQAAGHIVLWVPYQIGSTRIWDLSFFAWRSATSRNYDLVFGEEANTVDKQLVLDAFPDSYDYVGCDLGSSDIGFCTHRDRYWFSGINRATLIYTGPRGPERRDAILQMFGRAVHPEADDFFGLSGDNAGRTFGGKWPLHGASTFPMSRSKPSIR